MEDQYALPEMIIPWFQDFHIDYKDISWVAGEKKKVG